MTDSETHGARAASRTALLVAAYRARCTAAPDGLFSDPWAAPLSGADGAQMADTYETHFPYMQLWINLRTAAIDHCLKSAVDSGIRQIVMLGAGLDTRAARLSRDGVQFFEVDHPESQRDKLARLAGIDGYPFKSATYVTCDFEHQDFLDQLTEAGFSTDAPALFIWEGVVCYLTESAVRATLERIATGAHPSSRVIFDYVMRRIVESDRISPGDKAMRRELSDLGEPLQFGINNPVPLLSETGFRSVQTQSFEQLALALTGTYSRDRVFRFQHIALAGVSTPDSVWTF
jgi:methyltransferase (TIGR00027 family)